MAIGTTTRSALNEAKGQGEGAGRADDGTTGDADTTEDWLAKGRTMGTIGATVERAAIAGSADRVW